MIIKDYYRILEFKSNRVDVNQIKASYRELAKKYHPDLNVGNPQAEERFKDINEAYRVLTDGNSRKKYDRMWNSYIGKNIKYKEPEITEERGDATFFSILFGDTREEKKTKSRTKVPVKGDNIETEIDVSIEEAFNGAEKKVALRAIDGEMKTFAIKVPAGIRNHEKIRLIGQGKEGKNGGKNGDLFIKINIENTSKLQLYGYDIITPLELSPWEAALGTKANVTGIDGISTIHVPSGTQTGEQIRLKQKGYKDGKGGRGDLIIQVQIMVPKKLTEKEKELFKKLKEVSKYNPRTKEETYKTHEAKLKNA